MQMEGLYTFVPYQTRQGLPCSTFVPPCRPCHSMNLQQCKWSISMIIIPHGAFTHLTQLKPKFLPYIYHPVQKKTITTIKVRHSGSFKAPLWLRSANPTRFKSNVNPHYQISKVTPNCPENGERQIGRQTKTPSKNSTYQAAPMVGENRRLVHISRWISHHGQSKFPTIGWQSDFNFNPPAISRWTRKCPGNVANSSCELLDFSRKKYPNNGQYPGNGKQYPPGHEHGNLSAGRSRGCQGYLKIWTCLSFHLFKSLY